MLSFLMCKSQHYSGENTTIILVDKVSQGACPTWDNCWESRQFNPGIYTWGDWSLRTTPTTTALMSSSARTPRSILFGDAKEDAPASAASQGQDMSCPLMKP